MIKYLCSSIALLLTAIPAGCTDLEDDASAHSLATVVDLDAGLHDVIDASVDAPSDAGPDADDGDAALLPASKRAEPVLINGPGCPSGSASATWSDDRMSADVTFHGRYISDVSRISTTCIITLPTPSVPGRSYTIASIVTNGALSLGANARARFWTRFWVEGEYTLGVGLREEFMLHGAQNGGFENDGKGISYNPWTPCDADRDLLLEQRLNVLGASGADAESSFARIDRIRVRLSERVCSPGEVRD